MRDNAEGLHRVSARFSHQPLEAKSDTSGGTQNTSTWVTGGVWRVAGRRRTTENTGNMQHD